MFPRDPKTENAKTVQSREESNRGYPVNLQCQPGH